MSNLNALQFSTFIKNIDKMNAGVENLTSSLHDLKTTLNNDNPPDTNIYVSRDRKSYYHRDNYPEPKNTFGNNENWLSWQLIKMLPGIGTFLSWSERGVRMTDVFRPKNEKLIQDPYDPYEGNKILGGLWTVSKFLTSQISDPKVKYPMLLMENLYEYVQKEDKRKMMELNRRHYLQPEKQESQIMGDVLGNTADPNAFIEDRLKNHFENEDKKRILDDFNKPYLGKTKEELKQIDAEFTKTLKNMFQPKNKEANHAVGPSEKNKQNKRYKKKIYKAPKPKTTPDEDYGDGFLNQVYNTSKSALELNNAKFDKSKLLVESINFENAYLEAFHKEIDYKKEIGILQNELSQLEGDDLETKQKQYEIQSKINDLNNQNIGKFLGSEAENIQNLELKKAPENEIKAEINKVLEGIEGFLKTPNLSKRQENELLIQKQYYQNKKEGFDAKKAGGYDEERVKSKPSQKPLEKKKEDPLETFQNVFGEVQKVGGAMTTIMQTLHIGTDTFVGGVINGFNNALSIVQSILAVMQAMQTINSFLKFLPIPGLATGGTVPGTGNSDTVPAMLTPGEFVIKKSVVNKLGTQFFDHLNGGGFSSSIIGRYANGGVVASVPAQPQAVAVSIPDIKLKGSDLYLSWRRENKTYGRRSI